jgi:phosphate-selective porin OprO/OprP
MRFIPQISFVLTASVLIVSNLNPVFSQTQQFGESPWQNRQSVNYQGVPGYAPIPELPGIDAAIDPNAAPAELKNPVGTSQPKTPVKVDEPKAATPETPKTKSTDLTMKAKWKDGLELATADEAFRIHIGGRYQFDTSYVNAADSVQDNIGNKYGSGADFRRARFRIDGTLYKTIDWAAEFDFVNAALIRNQPTSATNFGFQEQTVTAPTDLWVQFKELPHLGNVRIGNQKEPIGFEHLVSSRYLPLMERSYNQDAFYGGTYNGFTPGIQAFRNYGVDDMGLIQAGLFHPVDSVFAFNTGTDDYAVTGRVTKLLSYEDDGRYLTHLGVSGRQATAVSNNLAPGAKQTFRTRDAIRAGLASDWSVPAGITLFGDNVTYLNSEFVMVRGQWTLQAEALASWLSDAQPSLTTAPTDSVFYHGGYIQVLRYLTDDYDHYDKKTGVFGRVKPLNNYQGGLPMRCSGGAQQIGMRYNYLDLNDSGLNGGVLHNLTLGYNWFFNPNVKFQTNYIFTYRDVSDVPAFSAGSGLIHGLGTRLAIDF